MRLIVTGGAGFIGSAVVRAAIARGDFVLNIDSLTYAGNLESIESVSSNPHYSFSRVNITDAPEIERLIGEYSPDAIIHLAAESHVDRSIDSPGVFIQTNVVGSYTLLEAAFRYWKSAGGTAQRQFRFLQVSTDEVYGSLGPDGFFVETTPYAPNSPYSASKAAGDHLARAWFATYGLPVIVSNCSNNYGSFQHPEKLIPTIIRNALNGTPIPIYGDGQNRRDWLHVEDHVAGLFAALDHGTPGENYNFGGRSEVTNLDMAKSICRLLDKKLAGASDCSRLIKLVSDRPGHDMRYAIDPSRAERELGWSTTRTLNAGLAETIDWYLSNRNWLLVNGRNLNRLGLERIGADR